MQQPESEGAARVAARVGMGVLSTVCVAVEMKVRAIIVRVRVQVPAPTRVAVTRPEAVSKGSSLWK